MRLRVWVTSLCFSLGSAAGVHAQDGATLFKTYCATCHEAAGDARIPSLEVLRQKRPEEILQALDKGVMRAQAAERSRAQRRALAEYLSGRPVGTDTLNQMPASAFCGSQGTPFRDSVTGPAWNGWGVTIANSRFQPAESAGLTAADVPRLSVKWAFGFPGATSGGTQPVVVGGRVYVASAQGDVYALSARTGCIHWSIEVEAGVRSALTIGTANGGVLTAYFGDQAAHVYAVNAESGTLVWKVKVDQHSRAAITGAPQLHDGRLYVPVSSREESQGGDSSYPCCGFRGSVVALDAASGKQIWKTYTVDQPAIPTRPNTVGTQLLGPSGVAVFNAPTLDVRRNTLYVGTGNNYSPPATRNSDSIVAFDMKSGKIRWTHQLTKDDVWNGSCLRPNREPAVCPDKDAPDNDFVASSSLVELRSGRRILVGGNKSGVLFALDPDRGGKMVWRQQVGKGLFDGGVMWGFAVDGENVYMANADFYRENPAASGGMTAVELNGGRILWTTPPPPCGSRTPCKPSQPAAASVIPGVVFSGSMDGQLRAYSTGDGKIIWEHDTAREYTTVNGVKANGGSMSNGGAAIVDGMVFTNSGYSHHGGVIPGNVLLAFGLE